MADLFSCPFCGGSDVSPSSFDVKCMECGAEMPGGTERAIAAWNRRAPSPDMREAVEALTFASGAFETIRLNLVHNLNEPERSAFWGAVQARDKIDAALRSLTGAKP